MAQTEDDLLKDAIAATENEIFSDAVGKDLPSTEGGPGDRSAEEMGEGLEGQHEPEEASSEEGEGDEAGEGEGAEVQAGAENKGEGEGEKPVDANRDPKSGQFTAKAEGDKEAKPAAEKPVDPKARVSLSDLMTERKARQAAEERATKLDQDRETERREAREEIIRLNARLDQALANGAKPAQPQPQAEAPAKPDIFTDPDAFIADLTQSVEQRVTQRYVAADLARTHDEHGEKFEKAYAALTSLDKSDPQARATVQGIWNSPRPGADLMKWHARQETLRTVGDDPAKFEADVRQRAREDLAKDPEFRKQLLEELRTGAQTGGDGGKPRTVSRMPRSLNGAAGGQSGGAGAQSVDGSDRGVFENAFRDQ